MKKLNWIKYDKRDRIKFDFFNRIPEQEAKKVTTKPRSHYWKKNLFAPFFFFLRTNQKRLSLSFCVRTRRNKKERKILPFSAFGSLKVRWPREIERKSSSILILESVLSSNPINSMKPQICSLCFCLLNLRFFELSLIPLLRTTDLTDSKSGFTCLKIWDRSISCSFYVLTSLLYWRELAWEILLTGFDDYV